MKKGIMFRNSRKKFMISKKQIFQSKKVRSRSGIRQLVANNGIDNRNIKILSNMQRSEESLFADRILENESRNELQKLQKWGSNKLVSDKEYDIKIYNSSSKDGSKTPDGENSIINKLSGSSIIIVYENGSDNKTEKSDSKLCQGKESSKSIKVITDLVKRRQCNGDISNTDINFTSSSSSNKIDDTGLNPCPITFPTTDNQKKIIIQCCSSKRNKNKETEECEGKSGGREKNRLKLIPPEDLSEPKCLKIVKKAINNETDLIHDLSNMMTGGRLIKTLKSFLGDHNNKEETKSSYVEIVQKLDESNEKHKILIFKRQIEKCKKCKEEDQTQNNNPDKPPESNIIRLTVKKDNKNEPEKNNDNISESLKNNKTIPSELQQSFANPNAIIGGNNSHMGENTKHKLSLLRNSMLPNSNYNILLASTLNELAGTLNARNSLKVSTSSKENLNSKINDSAKSNLPKKGSIESSPQSSKKDFKKIDKNEKKRSVSQLAKPQEAVVDSLNKKFVNLNDAKKNDFNSSSSENTEVNVLCPPKIISRKIENHNSMSQKSESIDLNKKYQETIQSDEICNVGLDDSKYDCLEKDYTDTTSAELKIYKKSIDKNDNDGAKLNLKGNQNTSMILCMNSKSQLKNSSPSKSTGIAYRPPDYAKIPSLENDNSFMQLFDPNNLQKMGKNEFLVDPVMKSMKTEYYILKKSYAAPTTLNRMASSDSVKHSEPTSKEQSKTSLIMEIKESGGNLSLTDSDDTIDKIHVIKKMEWPHKYDDQSSYLKEKQNHFKLDFMNFDMHRQLDSFISHDNEQEPELLETIPSSVKCKSDMNSGDKKKKKKNALWQMKENACKIMRSSHTNRRKVI